MLEKIVDVALVTKQCAILLLEADFNCHNKLIFGKRMLNLASENKNPEEVTTNGGSRAASNTQIIVPINMCAYVMSA